MTFWMSFMSNELLLLWAKARTQAVIWRAMEAARLEYLRLMLVCGGLTALLAVVLASLGGDMRMALIAIGGAAAFGLLLWLAGHRLLAPLGRIVEREGRMSELVLAITLVLFVGVALGRLIDQGTATPPPPEEPRL